MATAQTFDRLTVLPDLDSGIVRKIQKWLEDAADSELFRINLISWAGKWGVDIEKTVTHFLHLTKAGIMDLSWDIHCPQCNVVLAQETTLQKASPVHHCQFCIKDVESRFDDHFEVTFTVNAGVRTVKGWPRYEPSANVEIYLKEKIPAGGKKTVDLKLPKSAAHLRFVSWPPVNVHVVPAGRGFAEPVVEFYGVQDVRYPEIVPAGEFRLSLKNAAAVEMNLMIENHDMREYEPHETSPRLSGLQVATSPAFRTLFGSETLSDRESLKVRTVTLVFTDIKGSTSMYQQLGDARAYNLVRDHFDILFSEIFRHGGTVVKTIGDSVMASFMLPLEAVKAMLAVQKKFRSFNEGRSISTPVHIRAGIHHGPAVVVTLNDRLDFFGTTINEAARIESTCDANELVLSEPAMNAAGVRECLEGRAINPFDAALKGLRDTYHLYRVQFPA